MARKTDKAVKDLTKEVKKLRKQNEKLAETIGNMRENQAWASEEVLSALESLTAHDAADEEEPEVTEAAQRHAKDLNVDLSSVKGTGSEGRVLVKDVEEAADESL